ncbi:MAG: DUF1294 domain-containing protein [Eubacteriales bacterium]
MPEIKENLALSFIKENLALSIFLAYIAIISIISVIVCIYDKKISKKNRVELRTPEKTLMLLSALGGSVAMFITMLIIRHKTKHVKFMLGIPLIIIVQAGIVFLLFHFGIF